MLFKEVVDFNKWRFMAFYYVCGPPVFLNSGFSCVLVGEHCGSENEHPKAKNNPSSVAAMLTCLLTRKSCMCYK